LPTLREEGPVMQFSFNCHACGREMVAEWSHIGQNVACAGCGKAMSVPAPMETAQGADATGMVVRFACPACGRKFATKPGLAGKKIRCNRCGGGVRVPTGEAVAVASFGSGSPSEHAAKDARRDGPAPRRSNPRGTEKPTARFGVDARGEGTSSFHELDHFDLVEEALDAGPSSAVLPSRSETMEQMRRQADEHDAAAGEERADKTKPKKKKKKKRKKSGYFDPKDTLILVGCASALVGVLGFLAWAYPHFRFPLGGFLCVIGFVVYLLGALSIRQLVAEEGLIKLIVYRFFPPYQLWFVVTRWSDTKDYFAFFLSGMIILSIGGAVIKTSPTGKKAEESEQVFQRMVRGEGAESPPAAVKRPVERPDD
jgi:DNA-directed RNA polymerase subunit RPC12/RpoP